MSFDVIIVGSGPAGVSAALELRERNVLILDVGFHAPEIPFELKENLYDLKKETEDLSPVLLGEEFESLHNVVSPFLSPKLKSPFLRFVTRDWRRLSPINSCDFEGALSFAEGGLSNAWGSGVYRFNDRELKDFPIKAADLNPFYDRLTSEIGISGCEDDLTPFFGSTQRLLPPLELDRLSSELLKRYSKKKRVISQKGISIGKPRLAVLTEALEDRQPYNYRGLEFFQPNIPAVYNASYTLRKLEQQSNITYRPGVLVQKYEETSEGIRVFARNLETNSVEEFLARKLVLAAGTINTSKIVLASSHDYATHLSLLDNAISFIPFVALQFIGAPQERRFFSGVQLNVVYSKDEAEAPIQGSFYGPTGILRSDLLMDLPLSIKGNLAAVRYLTPALGVLQLFYPDVPQASNYLKLNPDGKLEVSYQRKKLGLIERHLISAFRKLAFFSLPSLCKYPAPCNSYHYAGTLPMTTDPQRYETSVNGLLAGSKHVYVVDAANFSSLPSKNHTFTIMANSMRIAHQLNRELES